ncbi:sulfatase-like hydrolase/transferase [Halocynthiibacter sp. C4]|uniref:sulfatase family protein n=1 Tax=Halocynthiibacter sp. C4 TaxID=2992758 RepID=UPI00237A54AB|nr:sulfatase-like hydrolase/transferase [Halocynthiibacter sp. C4]MDE0589105.1 sulfatase-like hydrolase/transferase [Halocynthiibacter sp. C4]
MSRAPNILFLLPDQLRHDFLGCYGADFLQTPAIDTLADQGTRYETAISPSPICVPARASMLTGQPAHETGILNNASWLRPDRHEMGIVTWPEHLARHGYQTAAIGKMHFYPWDIGEGFQHRVIAEDKRHIHVRDDYHHALAAEGFEKLHGHDMERYAETKGAALNPLPDHLHVDRWVANQAAAHIRSFNDDRPFAMMVGFPGPHCPYDPPHDALDHIDPSLLPPALKRTEESNKVLPELVAGYKQDWAGLDYSELSESQIRAIRHHYAASVERLDQDIAMLINTLRETNQLENTIVVFASDHGDYLGDFGLMGKGFFHEPSIRVPMIVTDFRCPTPKVENAPVSLIDIFPSILSWAGLPSLAQSRGSILGTAKSDRAIFGVTARGMMLRKGRWKLSRYYCGSEALFDLEADPGEQENLIDQRPDIRAQLDGLMSTSLLKGMVDGHSDKAVPEASSPPNGPFHDPYWQRPYPASINS